MSMDKGAAVVGPDVLAPREELQQFLTADQRRIGDVYRLTRAGLGAEEIAERLNVASPGFVYGYRYQIDAALDGRVSSSRTIQRSVRSALRSLLSRGRDTLSPEALHLLQGNLAAVERAGELVDPACEAEAEVEEERSTTGVLERLTGVSGIYAFSYGWYLESRLDPAGENTLIKVGRVGDVAARIRQYASGVRTHMPEPLALIRVYSAADRDLAEVERSFHLLLSTAGHANPRRMPVLRSEVGKEWFWRGLRQADMNTLIGSVQRDAQCDSTTHIAAKGDRKTDVFCSLSALHLVKYSVKYG
ncbi:MAG TPA: hypothetical protein DCP11_04885 [Microbacteriaceae bacterium]|nr:hypothetical protein [Microbacteriaceae bacterium]